MDLVQIQTWNDFGESTYVGPVLQDQPDSQGWTDGCDHTRMYCLSPSWINIYLLFESLANNNQILCGSL